MSDLFLGLDIGTSGARAIVIDADGATRSEAKSAMSDHGANHRSPEVWWATARSAVEEALADIEPRCIRALSVDGTSGTVLPVDGQGRPRADGVMYNDTCTDRSILDRIASAAPPGGPALGASSALARVMRFVQQGETQCVHQADWIAGQFSGRWISDANNALKTGYDVEAGCWPDWIEAVGVSLAHLPEVVKPGTPIGPITKAAAADFGLSPDTLVVAGTTDGCASFLATGADRPGDGVTALGTTMIIKLLSDKPIMAPEYGIYSHRILGAWLAGGASNSGGAALLAHFDASALETLSEQIDPETDTGLDYYPLPRAGERFPINDPDLPPRLTPRPKDDARFLHGLLDGVAGVEALAYRRLRELGAPALASVRSVGGGAKNAVWTRIRARRLGVPTRDAVNTEAAYGAALLARRGAQ
ncbi:MAG: FGGY-family carbohydrate kinase [Alphaproteobacteria bacterium]|nr:FGGY-family carbohydrate kinase [Alphaproteobacteria bacterium]